MCGGIPLVREEGSKSNDDALSSSITPPNTTGSMTLQLKASSTCGTSLCSITSTNASLRWIASVAPSSELLGGTLSEQAIVDSWLSYGWSSIDLPIEVLIRSSGTASAVDFQTALQQLDANLMYNTYIAGTKSVTIADIRIIVSLYTAANAKLWDPTSEDETLYVNVKRWYQTLVNQDWFLRSIQSLPSLSSSTITSTAATSSSSVREGIMLNGTPSAVVNKMYRRNRIRIKEVFGTDGGASYIGQTITVAGWSRTIRKASSKLIFVELNDGSVGSSLQCVLDVTLTEGFEQCKGNGGTGSSFSFTGTVVKSVGEEQVIDLKVTQATLLGAVYGGNAEGTVVGGMLYPLSKKEHTLEHMRDVAHLRPRGQIHAAAMRIRHAMAYATHTFFNNHGFLYIHTPILTGADCEGAGEQFGVTTLLGSDHLKPDIVVPVHKAPEPPATTASTEGEGGEEKKISKSEMKRLAKQQEKAAKKGGAGSAAAAEPDVPEIVIGAIDYGEDFFAQRMNLTVSGQLNVETHACALSDVYTFGPTFRAEESRTYRHLSEFWMIEPEIAFATLKEDIDLAEDYLKYCVQYALDHCTADLEFFENNPHGEVGLRDRLKNVLHNEFKVRSRFWVT